MKDSDPPALEVTVLRLLQMGVKREEGRIDRGVEETRMG